MGARTFVDRRKSLICIPDAENDANSTRRAPKYYTYDPKAYEAVRLSDQSQKPLYLGLRIQTKDTTQQI